MLYDRYNRRIKYMRVAVTDRCNYRCTYCMPAKGVVLKRHADVLSYEQITAIVREAVSLGVRKVRLTGGEPLVRKGVEDLVANLAPLPGLEELCMTTNGILLPELAPSLKDNGLGRVNISIDSLNRDRYAALTRGGDLDAALAGVAAAVSSGLTPVKINMVVFADTRPEEIETMRSFCSTEGLTLQLINHFDLDQRRHDSGRVATERPPKCTVCDRLRLTADGYLKPCLFSDAELPVDFTDIRGSLLAAVSAKPQAGTQCRNRGMHAIGG